jgi:hypothetical protein
MNFLHVVTPLTRLHFVREVAESVLEARRHLPVTWYVLPDSAKVDPAWAETLVRRYVHSAHVTPVAAGCCWGGVQNNYCLQNTITDMPGWVYFLSDDNIIHPSLPPVLTTATPDHLMFLPQLGYDDSPLRGPGEPREGAIDLAQFVVPRQWATRSAFDRRYACDWTYLKGLLDQNLLYKWHPTAKSYYNALQPTAINRSTV